MAVKEVTATVMTPVRNGYSNDTNGTYDVGGPNTDASHPNNSIYMTFPSFGLTAGSTIGSATLSYTMTGWAWRAEVDIYLQACASAGTESNQVGCTGTRDVTTVPESTLVSAFAATNTAKQMLASGKYYLKMYCANGENRKNFTSTKAKMTVNYTPPTAPGAPAGIGLSPNPFEGVLGVSWSKGGNGTNNPITGHEVRYQTSSNGTSWSAETVVSVSASATSYAVPAATISGWARGLYVRARIGSKSAYASTVYSGYSASVRRNRVPNAPTNVGTSKTCYAPGEAIRVTFTNNSDPDGNLKGFEVAKTDSDTVLGIHNSGTATHVDVSTATGTWTPGTSYTLRVRARDTMDALSAWVNTPTVMVGLPMFVRPTTEDEFKRAVSMQIYMPGAGFRPVKSMKTAPVQGAINKTVF